MSDTEVGGLDRAGRLALASPYSRRAWGLALDRLGTVRSRDQPSEGAGRLTPNAESRPRQPRDEAAGAVSVV